MSTPHQDAIEAWTTQHGASREALAKEILKRASELGSSARYTPGSLRVLLPKWATGERSLSADPMFQQAVSDVLDRPLIELFPSATPPDRAYPLREFPRLGAMDLLDDAPCDTSSLARDTAPGEKVASIFLAPPRGKVWVTAPPGAGRTLAVRRWQARHDREESPRSFAAAMKRIQDPIPRVLAIRSLAEIAGHPLAAAREPRVIKVDLPSPQDAATIEALSSASRLLVLAGFPFPSPARTGWEVLRWAPDRAWRASFVRWVAQRVEKIDAATDRDSTLDAVGMIRWLDEHDPDCTRYATPGDLLAVLALADEAPEELIHGRIDRAFVSRALALRAREARTSTLSAWCAREGAGTAVRLIEAGFASPSLPWPARLDLDAWSQRVPDDLLPHGDARLEAVRDTLARGGRGAAQRAIAALDAPDRPRQVISALCDAGMLHPVAHDRFEVGPRWAQDVVATHWCADAFSHDAPGHWGRLSLDPARRAIVDEALDALDDSARAELVLRTLDGFDATRLGDIGAVESLYVLVGESLARREASKDERRLYKRLWHTARTLWVRGDFEDLPGSRTRGVPGNELTPGSARWWAACWGWSLGMPIIDRELPSAWAWLFPGWFPSLDAPPDALRWHDGPSGDRGVEALYALAPRFISRWTGVAGDVPPAIVRAVAIPRAPAHPWNIATVVGSLDAIDDDLATRIDGAIADEQRSGVLRALWEVALSGSGWISGRLWPVSQGVRDPTRLNPLARRLRAHFPVDLVAIKLSEAPGLQDLDAAALLKATPPPFRCAMFDALLEHRPTCARDAVSATDLVDIELLSHAADRLDPADAWPIAQRVWRLDPARARRRAEEEWAEHGRTAPWLESFSLEHSALAVKILRRHPERPVPQSFLRFLCRALPTLGPDADAVFALLQRAGWETLRP